MEYRSIHVGHSLFAEMLLTEKRKATSEGEEKYRVIFYKGLFRNAVKHAAAKKFVYQYKRLTALLMSRYQMMVKV